MSKPPPCTQNTPQGIYAWCTTATEEQIQAILRAQSARKDYDLLKYRVNGMIVENVQDGLDGVGGGNFEVAGSVFCFKDIVHGHLKEHLNSDARKEISRFGAEVNRLLRDRLNDLIQALRSKHDVRRAIADLGYLLCIYWPILSRVFLRFRHVKDYQRKFRSSNFRLYWKLPIGLAASMFDSRDVLQHRCETWEILAGRNCAKRCVFP